MCPQMLSEFGCNVHVSRLNLVEVFLDSDTKLLAGFTNTDRGAVEALKAVDNTFLKERGIGSLSRTNNLLTVVRL